MEMIVVLNKGFHAAKAGEPRIAPSSIQYPVTDYVTKQVTHYDEVTLDNISKRVWFQGFDKGKAA